VAFTLAFTLVAQVMKRLAEVFSEEREKLESQWPQREEVSTEELRVALQRYRWKVERTFAWLGNYRRLVVRYEWLAHVYWAFVLLAFISICLERILK
jgi:transposase